MVFLFSSFSCYSSQVNPQSHTRPQRLPSPLVCLHALLKTSLLCQSGPDFSVCFGFLFLFLQKHKESMTMASQEPLVQSHTALSKVAAAGSTSCSSDPGWRTQVAFVDNVLLVLREFNPPDSGCGGAVRDVYPGRKQDWPRSSWLPLCHAETLKPSSQATSS